MSSLLHRLRFRRDHRWTPPHLSPYLEGELGGGAVARVRRHVRECPECRALLRSLEAMLGLLGGVAASGTEPAPDIADGVRRRLAP